MEVVAGCRHLDSCDIGCKNRCRTHNRIVHNVVEKLTLVKKYIWRNFVKN